ncbi:MAG: hypothetical protein V8S72_03145 [Oscillospiraceae bacterium]
MVQRGKDPQPVSTTPLLRTGAAGLATLGLLLDEESGDAEEQRRRIEARIAAENFGAVVGFAAGVALAVKKNWMNRPCGKNRKSNSSRPWEDCNETGLENFIVTMTSCAATRGMQANPRRSEDGGVETLFRDSTAKWEGDDLTRQRAMLVGGKCFFVTSVFPGSASATPTDKLLQLIDAKLEREHHEQ